MKLKASEVMIGNWAWRFAKPVQLTAADILAMANCLTEFEPIYPSVRWLLASEFKQVKARSGVVATFVKNGVRVSLSNSGNYYIKHRIVGVHDIQNAIQVLTGEQLKTINP